MTGFNDERLQQLRSALYQILQEHPEGMREFDLMAALSAHAGVAYHVHVRGDMLSLFQSHFLLFHCLYRLRDELRCAGEFDLDIHCLSIQLLDYQNPGSNYLGLSDSLREYYLDLSHLTEASADGVADLLDKFWGRYAQQDEHTEALEVFGLTAPVEYSDVRARYRRLVMDHHPDRGGSTSQIQLINESFSCLKRYYSD